MKGKQDKCGSSVWCKDEKGKVPDRGPVDSDLLEGTEDRRVEGPAASCASLYEKRDTLRKERVRASHENGFQEFRKNRVTPSVGLA